ncbi:uncharacterized protein si:ch211-199g17.9 [Xyrauchen texanus]|uniref:uncharacterized protein si:ch211-199g17.9 n=1 Tax=Xyrauchen texanus TaxID=154827 RepID=UPI002241DCB0|nr:uncharacterized protein si:ch211-199g17.9 [Xyrauchen texanus]
MCDTVKEPVFKVSLSLQQGPIVIERTPLRNTTTVAPEIEHQTLKSKYTENDESAVGNNRHEVQPCNHECPQTVCDPAEYWNTEHGNMLTKANIPTVTYTHKEYYDSLEEVVSVSYADWPVQDWFFSSNESVLQRQNTGEDTMYHPEFATKKDLEDEVTDTMLLRSTRKEEDALTAEVLQLEEKWNEKEVLNRSLQLKCEHLKQKAQRQLELNHQKEELVKQYLCQIEETKLKHRKIRMKFQNQLLQLLEQHKNLSTIFTPQRLPAEIQSAEYITVQLLRAEQQKLEQLAKLLGGLSPTQTGEMQIDTCDTAS